MPQDFISVTEASERYGYSDSHIRNLLIKGQIEGEKFASVWMVDARSLEKYKSRMEQLGSKKHGLRPATSTPISVGLSYAVSRSPDPERNEGEGAVEGAAEGPHVPMTARAVSTGDGS
jgi:hypothetical protein